jgi:hypothetical protein
VPNPYSPQENSVFVEQAGKPVKREYTANSTFMNDTARAGRMPTPQEDSVFVERAEEPVLENIVRLD